MKRQREEEMRRGGEDKGQRWETSVVDFDLLTKFLVQVLHPEYSTSSRGSSCNAYNVGILL